MTVRTRSAHDLGRGASVNSVEIRVTTDVRDDVDLRHLDAYATVVIESGACYLQTYADADTLRAMARSLLAAAADLDQIAPVVIAREAA